MVKVLMNPNGFEDWSLEGDGMMEDLLLASDRVIEARLHCCNDASILVVFKPELKSWEATVYCPDHGRTVYLTVDPWQSNDWHYVCYDPNKTDAIEFVAASTAVQ